MTEQQQPSVGRVVHYVAYYLGTPGGEFPAGVCRAAVITEVEDPAYTGRDSSGLSYRGRVSVCVMNPTGLFFNRGIPYDEAKAPGSWHWPERV